MRSPSPLRSSCFLPASEHCQCFGFDSDDVVVRAIRVTANRLTERTRADPYNLSQSMNPRVPLVVVGFLFPATANRRCSTGSNDLLQHGTVATISPTQVDQRVHDRVEFGPRFQGLDVGVSLDLLGQRRVGIDRLTQQNDCAAEVIPRQTVAVGLRELAIAANLSDQPSQNPSGVKAGLSTLGGRDGLGHVECEAGRFVIGPKLQVNLGQINQMATEQLAISGAVLAELNGRVAGARRRS